MPQMAQDTFVAELADGTSIRVGKGEVLHDKHELVRRDQKGSGTLFSPLDTGDDPAPARRSQRTRRGAEADPETDEAAVAVAEGD